MSTITREFTKEQLQQIIETDHVQCGEASALARIALASLEAEASGRNPVLAYADSYRDMANQGVESIPVWSVITDLERNIAPLFTAPPAPISVPAAMEMDDDFDSSFEHGKAVGWNAYRAAMLQGAEPVSQPYTLPEVIDENLVEGLRLLQCMLDDYRERNYGHAHEWIRHIDRKFAEHSESHEDDAYSIFSSLLQGVENAETPTTMQTAPALDSSPKIAELPSGNSPVIPDGWVACSERMPEGMTDVHISNGHDVGQGWWDGETWQTQHDYYSVPGDVTHWMPLPAAPQQEVK